MCTMCIYTPVMSCVDQQNSKTQSTHIFSCSHIRAQFDMANIGFSAFAIDSRHTYANAGTGKPCHNAATDGSLGPNIGIVAGPLPSDLTITDTPHSLHRSSQAPNRRGETRHQDRTCSPLRSKPSDKGRHCRGDRCHNHVHQDPRQGNQRLGLLPRQRR